jgi:3-oxoadipate enol-lactonase
MTRFRVLIQTENNMTIPLQKMRVGDIDIEYQVSDYTDPWTDTEPETILFHHGYCRNMDFWRGWVPGLARNYRVLRFNSRGCGGTTVPPPGAPYDARELVGDALGLMDKLGIKRAHWVGESSGGILGIVAALTHPERLHSLVLVNTPFKLPGAVMETYNVGEADHATAIEKLGVGGWCRATLPYRIDITKASLEMQEWIISEMGKVANHVAIAHHLMAAGGDMTKRITEIKMPILILVGENSPLAQKDQMEQMKARLPNAKLVMFEGYGHGINLLIPDRCVAEMRAFLDAPAAA